jgi:dTDP-glucose 4,6-dehydratase
MIDGVRSDLFTLPGTTVPTVLPPGRGRPYTKTILITGGAGFIGSNFVRHLYNRYPQARLLVLDNLTYAGSIHNLPNKGHGNHRFEFWYGDVRNGELVDTLVARSDVVVHMAAESSVTRSIFDNRLFFETDVIGTQTVANSVTKNRARIERFIHISTSEVYGTAETDLMSEDHPLKPMSPYAAAKCGADRLVWSYWSTYGIPAVIVRPFNNFGPRQHLEKVVPRFVTSCLLKEPLRVHGNGSAARDFLYVEDHCEALELLLLADRNKVVGQVINLGTGRHVSVLEIAHAVRDLMGATDAPIKCVGDRPGQVFRHTADFSRARDLLGWTPATSFEEGLRKTIEWYQANEAWWRPQVCMREIPIVTASGVKELH